MRRAFGDLLTRLRRAVLRRSPAWARRAFGPTAMYFDMLIFDHGILRLAYANRHRLSDSAWRSGQPGPRQIGAWARRGVRTIVNLRGRQLCGSYWLEQKACAEHGITLVDFPMRSYEAPTKVQLYGAKALFEEIEYPVLIHCKSGADRTGLMGILYRVVREGAPMHEARLELSLRYGHLRRLETGILDYFIERYLADTSRTPMDFFSWVDRVYDREEVTRSFRASSWLSRSARPTAAGAAREA